MSQRRTSIVTCAWAICAAACGAVSGAPPKGADDVPPPEEAAAIKEVGQQAAGLVVWSSSRIGNHDLFTMKTDGSEVKQITSGDAVDWFPRFAPDGSQIVFSRSKQGWVSERDANASDKWDIFTVAPDGSGERKRVDSASWASWLSNDEILYVRGTKIFRKKLDGDEQQIMDSEGVPELDGALLQQPELSKDGKYLAITLRGSKRETGLWDIEAKKWTQTGLGCQINWTPDQTGIYWVHPTGNGGSRILQMPITAGAPPKDPSLDELELMDLPGRRSHEYFPELSPDGKWLIWAATQRGHDHDTADYEIYLWQVGSPSDKAVRLTHNSGNDRWPDLFLPSAAPTEPAPSAIESAVQPDVDVAAASESPSNDAVAPDAQEKLALGAKADGSAPEKKKNSKRKKKKAKSARKSEPAQP
jgi:Tol biopolymer transport system component